jgi:hypothetical protein
MIKIKRLISTLIVSFIFLTILKSQNVDSIRVEQAGDFVKISYSILNSNSYQVYNVRILFSMDGGLKTELRSVSGDIGNEVLGGKKEYVVLWDALKDVDEVKSVEFFVRAELVKDNSEMINGKADESLNRKFFALAAVEKSGDNITMGLRIAYMAGWGVSARFLAGPAPFDNDADIGKYISISSGADLTKRILNNQGFQLHILAGLSILRREPIGTVNEPKKYFSYDAGLIFALRRISFCLSLSSLKKGLVEGPRIYPELGIGAKF